MSTMQSIKTQLQSLLNRANTKTGKSHTNLTDVVSELINGYGSGDEEIPTCTVTFHIGEEVYAYGDYCYTKYEDGIISTESVYHNDGTSFDESSVTLENVVCGSLIYFHWYPDSAEGEIVLDGNVHIIANNTYNEYVTPLFVAQSEPNTTSTITLLNFSGVLPPGI